MNKCYNCEKKVSDFATSCPYCGADLTGERNIQPTITKEQILANRQEKKNILKNILVIASLVLLAIAIVYPILFGGEGSRGNLLLYLCSAGVALACVISCKMLNRNNASSQNFKIRILGFANGCLWGFVIKAILFVLSFSSEMRNYAILSPRFLEVATMIDFFAWSLCAGLCQAELYWLIHQREQT